MMQFPIVAPLKNGSLVELDAMQSHEQETVRAMFNTIVEEGQTYPHKKALTHSEFAAYWLVGTAYVVRHDREIVGAFFLKPNFPGRSAHIANAGFIVPVQWRGSGVGRFMGENMLEIARDRGYSAVMFNLVFETNVASIELWRSLNFSIVGRIPNAAQLSNGQMIDALIFYRSLTSPE